MTPIRTLVLGDMQAPLDTLLAVLDRHGALAGDTLRAGVHLVSVGDHVDFGDDPERAATEGERVLDWMAAQAPERLTLLLGNHDAARVMEFAGWSDARFSAARIGARAVHALPAGAARDAAEAAFRACHPGVPTLDLVRRDYAGYTEGQAARIAGLLRAGRMRLAATVRDADGRALLVTHAGVTRRELELLVGGGWLDPACADDAVAVAASLERFLDAALRRWEEPAAPAHPLDLAPLYLAGVPGQEAGGLLYHRPATDDDALRPKRDRAWELDPTRPRRYAPARLPRGFSQVCGHTPHARAWRELVGFTDGPMGSGGAVRTLLVGAAPRYVARRLPPAGLGEAHVYYVDAQPAHTPVAEVEAFEA
jgi:hypothetical protein